MRRGASLFALVAAAALAASPAAAYWTTGSEVRGTGASAARSLPTPGAPAARAVGPVVTVSWAPSAFTAAPLQYDVLRYASTGQAPTGAGTLVNCVPAASGDRLECADGGVPPGTYQYAVRAKLSNWRGAESAPSPALQVYNDTTAPTTTVSRSPAKPASGWHRTTPVRVTLTAADNAGGSGVAQTLYTLDGSDPRTSQTAIPYAGPVSLSATATVRYSSRDRANNAEAPKAEIVQIDVDPPLNSPSVVAVTGGAHVSGTTIHYRGVAAGSFRVVNAVADGTGSGPASSRTSALAGTATGWTHTASTVSTPAGGPYQSNLFSWVAGTTSAPTETVTATDVAGNTRATAPALQLRNDSAAPSTAASVSPAPNAAGWNRGPVTVSLTAADNAGGAGVRDVKYTTDGSSPRTSATASAYTGPFGVLSTATVRYAAADLVGNAEAEKVLQVRVDPEPPSAAPALGSVTGGAFMAAGTVFYRGVAAGSFTLVDTATDTGGSGASSSSTALTGDAAGWTHTPSTVSTPAGGPFESAPFSWPAGTSSSPRVTVTTADVADNSVATDLGLVDDSVAPTGGIAFPGEPTYSAASAWAAGCGTAAEDVCGDVADALSGIQSARMTVRRASDGRCWNSANGKWGNGACNGRRVDYSAGSIPAWTEPFPCLVDSFTMTLTVVDRVGNSVVLPARNWSIAGCA